MAEAKDANGEPVQKYVRKTENPCTAALSPENYQYLLLHTHEPANERELRLEAEAMPQPNMISSGDEIQFFAWFVGTLGARRVIEVGVFRGVTTLALARAVGPGGIVRALDITEEFVEVGRRAWEAAGVADRIDFRVAPAADSLRALLAQEGEAGTYDFIYIDANKDQYVEYYELGLQLLRPGGVIAVDNTIFHGLVTSEEKRSESPNAAGVHALNEVIRQDDRVAAVMTLLADGVYFVRKL